MIAGEAPGTRVRGIATATGWWEADFQRRQEVIEDLLTPSSRYRGRHMAAREEPSGLGLETITRRVLRGYGIAPMWERSGHNALVSAGSAIILDALIGTGVTFYSNANAALGAGDSATPGATSQTNLQGAVNVTDRIRKAMNATFPSRSGSTLTFQSNFGTTDANFTWNEWAIFNNATDGSGTMLNRGVVNLGTKTSAASWTLTGTLSIS